MLNEDGDVFYIFDNGDTYYADDDGNIYYVDDNGNYTDVGSGTITDDWSQEYYDGYDDADDNNDPEGSETEYDEYYSDAPIGYEVGDKLEDFEVDCLDGSTFSTAGNRGKVVIINLWATYCGPCVKELPHFVELYHQNEDDIAILAVHAKMTVEDVGRYLQDKDWDIQFAIDDDNETIFKIVNGSTALPHTIVLNRKGEVVYNRVGSITAEMLDRLYKDASQ